MPGKVSLLALVYVTFRGDKLVIVSACPYNSRANGHTSARTTTPRATKSHT